MNKIYLIVEWDYEDCNIHSFFTEKDKAEKYIMIHTQFDIKEIKLNDGEGIDFNLPVYKRYHFHVRDYNLGIDPNTYTPKKTLGVKLPDELTDTQYGFKHLNITADNYKEALERGCRFIDNYKKEVNWHPPETEDILGKF